MSRDDDQRPYLRHPRPRRWGTRDPKVLAGFLVFSLILIVITLLTTR